MATLLEITQKPFIELQIEALVEENRIKPRRVGKFVDKLKKLLLNFKSSDIDDLLNRQFRLPLLGRPNSMNDDYPKNFKFIPPQDVSVVGGFRTSSALKKTTSIDVAVCMPAECLTVKDTKNQRYQHKRALYLAQLANLLSGSHLGSRLIDRIEFQYHQGDFLKPVLRIVPEDEKLRVAGVVFQIFVYPPQNCAIKLSHLIPSHGNVAPRWFFKDYPLVDTDSEIQEHLYGDSDIASTPFYNSSILFDLEMVANSNILSEQLETHTSLIEALVMTKVWLFQRDLHQHFSFILSMYIAYLQTRQLVHQNMSSYQIFKVIIKSITASEWNTSGLSYYDDSKDKISSFKPFFPVIFLSPSGNLNLCYNITNDLYERLKHEANLSQTILNANTPEMFDMLFLRKVSFITKFDVVVHVPKCTKKLKMNLNLLNKFMDHGVFTPRVYADSILDVLHRALTDRVVLIQQSSDHLLINKKWNLKSIPYDPSNEDTTFTLGLMLEPEKSLRIIDIGPGADSPDAEEFRMFWEPKSQLRLQNGVISETVVWHVKSFSQRRAIIKYILDHAFKRFDINNVVVHYTLLERFISLNNVAFKWRDEENTETSQALPTDEVNSKKRKRVPKIDKPIGVGEEVFQRVLHAYNEMNKIVRSVDNLKHSITGIQPMSHHLRSCGVFPPLPVSLQSRNKSLKRQKGVSLFPTDFAELGKILHIEPVEILLTLDSASKWPNEYEAFEAAKVEYLIQMGEALKEKEYSVKFSEDYLDVLQGQFVFRLRIKCQKEIGLIGGANVRQKQRYETEILPRVNASLDQLYREKPAFGLTCRLVKRWLSCHFMTDHINDITLDLMVAHVFLHPQPYSEPASSLCGFQRFLMLVSEHDWKQTPLVVNFDNQLKVDELTRTKEAMMAATENQEKSKWPPIVISTPYDKEMISPWTSRSDLDEMGLELLVRICSKALQYFNQNILLNPAFTTDECKALFLPNFKMFNMLIKLHPLVVQNFFLSINPPKDFRLVGKEPSGRHVSALQVMPIVGMNMIEQYVNVLRNKYKNVAMFFYDKYGQRLIGVVLKPESKQVFGEDLSKFIMGIKSLGSKLVESVTRVNHTVVKRDNQTEVTSDESLLD